MQTRPNHIPPQTIAQARAAYRKYGPRLSEREARQIARGAELQRRADAIRDAERRRKANALRRAEKEAREREARARMNIASQKAYVAASQIRLDEFVRVSKAGGRGRGRGPGEEQEKEQREGVEGEDQGNEQDQGEAEEPWEEEGVGDEEFLGILGPAAGPLVDVVRTGDETRLPESEPRVLDREVSGEQGANALDTGFDEWDAFLVSNTQIEREITTTTVMAARPQQVSFFVPSLSTQDLTFDEKDMDELGLGKTRRTDAEAAARVLMLPPPCVPTRKAKVQPPEKLISYSLDDFVLSTQNMREIEVDPRVLMPPPPFIPARKPQTPLREKLVSFSPDDFVLSTQDMRDIDVAPRALMSPPPFVPVRKAQIRPLEKLISFSSDDFVLSTQDMRDIAG